MGTYRVEWSCCDSVTETQAWEPSECPFCAADAEKARADALEAELAALKARIERLVARMQLDLGAGKEGYTYTQYEQGRIAEKRKTLHELSILLPADGEG